MASFEEGEVPPATEEATSVDAPVPDSGAYDGGGGGAAALPGLYDDPKDAKDVNWKDAISVVSEAVASKTPILDVVISEPQTTKSMMKSFVTYQVFTKPLGHVVRRRYSDFQWLRSALYERYTGMLIPPLPPREDTAASTNQDSKFVQRRMRTLQKFISDVVANPYLRGDEAIISFVSVQQEKELEKAKAAASRTNIFNEPYIGCIAWREYLLNNPAPDNIDRVVLDLRKQLDFIEKSYNAALAASRRFSIKAGEYSREVAMLKDAFKDVLAQETIAADPTKVEANNSYGQEMVPMVTGLTENIDKWSLTTAQRPSIYENVVRPTLEFQLYQITAFRELLDYRELSKKELTAANKVMLTQKLKREQGKEAASSMFGKAKDINEVIREAEEDVKGKTLFLSVLSNALNWSEIFRFNETRLLQFKQMVTLMSTAENTFSSALVEIWRASMETHGAEVEAALAEIKFLVPEFESGTAGGAVDDVESV